MARHALVFLVVLAVTLSGCFQRSYRDGEETPTSTSAPPPPPPNFLGDWSQAQGNFTPLLVQTRIAVFERDTNESVARESCTFPYTFELDRANETLRLSRHFPLHPYDPGDLRVVLLHELILGERCIARGWYGVNDNSTTPDICLYGTDESEREAMRSPWRCHLPVEPGQDPNAAVWTNLTIPLAEGSYSLDVNGHAFAAGQGGNFSFWTDDPGRSRRYHTTVNVEPLGLWPYAAIER